MGGDRTNYVVGEPDQRSGPGTRALAAQTGETVDLSVLRGRQMWFIDQVESAHRLREVAADFAD